MFKNDQRLKYTFEFKPNKKIINKEIIVEAENKKEAKAKLIQELTKVNKDNILAVEEGDYNYKKFCKVDFDILVKELILIGQYYPTEPSNDDQFTKALDIVINHLEPSND
jgi:hypothetical protein|tara:strand:- start:29 stop:358 length:330 start_codon:yes stop_codon:yes gene_type:complete